MDLRKKIILILAMVMAAMSALISFGVPLVQNRMFGRIEKSLCEQKVTGVMAAFAQTMNEFCARYADYAHWDDTCAFIKDGNEAYIKSNYTEDALAAITVDFLAITDKAGKIVYGTAFDRAAGAKKPLPQAFLDHLKPGGLLLRHDDAASSRSGILMLPEGPVMVATLAVVNSKCEGPVQGAFIAGRYFNDQAIQRLSCYTLSSIRYCMAGAAAMPADFAQAVQALTQAGGGIHTRALDDGRSLCGYTGLNDLYGQPALLFRVDLPTELYHAIIRQGTLLSAGALCCLALMLFCCSWVLLGRQVMAPLGRVLQCLKAAAGHVNEATGKISHSSRQIAQGAASQAANLEETASTLAQLAAQSQANSEQSGKVDCLIRRNHEIVGSASAAMQQAEAAMQGIHDYSLKVTGIMRVIEEIAFKTNLLSLNAAVEAARAGEQGRGFAVVAEEVRRLARQSAEAAQSTAEIIAASVAQAARGAAVMQQASASMGDLTVLTATVSADMAAITQASRQQSQAIALISSAISDMDRITQQMATHTDAAAADCQGIAGQAHRLLGSVDDLLLLVGATQ